MSAVPVSASEKLIVALDHPNASAALEQVDELGELVGRYKVGLELFIAEGKSLVEQLQRRDKRIFLDLKLHDIPETVKRAAQLAGQLGVDLLTVHASGGKAMLEAAVAGAGKTRVLAVTVLTSLGESDLRVDGMAESLTLGQLALNRAIAAHSAGVAGVIASPLEAAAIRARFLPHELLIVTPGVRIAAANDDQKRIATPRAAINAGADAVVVGRPIRDADDRRAAAERFMRELA